MSPRLRLGLALLGFIVILFGLLALAYAFGPVQHVNEQAPIAPTLFVPPQSIVMWKVAG